MRNQYAGQCYRCGLRVKAGDGVAQNVAGKKNRVPFHLKCAKKEAAANRLKSKL